LEVPPRLDSPPFPAASDGLTEPELHAPVTSSNAIAIAKTADRSFIERAPTKGHRAIRMGARLSPSLYERSFSRATANAPRYRNCGLEHLPFPHALDDRARRFSLSFSLFRFFGQIV
jgi:hypothetical protein